MAITFPVIPMKGVLGALPPDDGWAFEIKWDGYRSIVFIDDGVVRLQSSSGLDMTATYPELAGLPDGVHAKRAVIDAELVVVGDDGRPRFELVQRHERQAALYAFDVLSIDGTDAISLPYQQRRELLAQLVEPGPNWMVPAYRIGDGAALLEATREQQLEGVMAKRIDSTYRPGGRSTAWRKVKNRQRIDVVIGGFTAGDGNRAGTFGSLLVGLPSDGRLAFAGGVGTGFDQRTLEALTKRLRALTTDVCPFDPRPPTAYRRTATWVRPELTATLEIAELTNDGYVRQASFIALSSS